jgi:regulator of replication initiation timing
MEAASLGYQMESVQKQVIVLSAKIDALHQVVDQLHQKVAELLENAAAPATPAKLNEGGHPPFLSHSRALLENSMEHKDVLADATHLDSAYQSGSKQLAPEVQIQRLTAQLTAAYNRIADLEEHLLSQRIH